MFIDFRIIKDATKEVLEGLDHTFLNELENFREQNPSSENIARYIFESLGRRLKDENVKVSRVSAWESDSACATYEET